MKTFVEFIGKSIKEEENAIGKIVVWQSQSDFEKFVAEAINENKLTNDDCAILCIELSESERKGIEYKKPQVTSLNDLINHEKAENEKQLTLKNKDFSLTNGCITLNIVCWIYVEI